MNVLNRRAVMVATLLLASCAAKAPPPPPPPVLDLSIKAGPGQNPDASGNPAPVAIQIYQLASTAAFNTADAYALSGNAQVTLGADLLGSEQVLLAPGESQKVAHPLKAGATYLGVVVLFRDINHAQWRASAPLAASGPTKLQLNTDKLSVTLTPAS